MEIVPVPAFTDNYIWLVHDAASGETAVVDPGDAAQALREAERAPVAEPLVKTPWEIRGTIGAQNSTVPFCA